VYAYQVENITLGVRCTLPLTLTPTLTLTLTLTLTPFPALLEAAAADPCWGRRIWER
jgi:hypothetical protein